MTASPRPAARRWWSRVNEQGARRHPPQGHRQGRHAPAVRPAPGDGHQDGDDHRRQPAHGGGHRGGGRRRRLPRRGDAGDQDGADQEGAAGRQAGGDDRRRHERRARPGAGRRRRGDEHRHPGRQGSRQHGGPRQQPDEADRDRGDRQAAADDARLADDVQHRQRRREVLLHHPGDVRGDLSDAGRHQLPALRSRRRADHSQLGGAGGGDLQRADHHRADPARARGGRLQADGRVRGAAPQPADLRRRRRARALPGIWVIDRLLVLLHLA